MATVSNSRLSSINPAARARLAKASDCRLICLAVLTRARMVLAWTT
jgi:hypothetical protein